MTTPPLEGGTPGSLLDDHIEPFLKHLRAAGYAERTLRKKRTVAKAFADGRDGNRSPETISTTVMSPPSRRARPETKRLM